jgi:DNA-binding CsgD family transcriptional regulator
LTKTRQSQHAVKTSAHPAFIEALRALKTLPVSVAILDRSGTVVAVNDTWREFAEASGLSIPDAGVGVNYLHYCVDAQLKGALKALLARRRDLVTQIYPCHSPSERRWFSLIGVPLSLENPGGVALMHVNLTSILPAQIDTRLMQAEGSGRSQLPPKADVAAISGVIEQSVSETLAAQLDKMIAGTRDIRNQSEQPIHLSERQLQVLQLLGEGKTNREIAEALYRSPNTIKLHVSAILKQLGLKSRTQAALLASQLHGEGAGRLPVGGVTPPKKRTAQSQRRR